MRQKLITLDQFTWELASKKTNFSEWIRNMLRSEHNKTFNDDSIVANTARKVEQYTEISTRELLYHLEQRSDDEIKALVSLLKKI